MISCHDMSRLITFLVVCALFLGQGFSAGAAMCVHRSATDHARALVSRDGAIAAIARNEDSAAALMAKKAAVSGTVGPSWVAHLVAPIMVVPPRTASQHVIPSFADEPAMKGISTAPLLRPPHAIA